MLEITRALLLGVPAGLSISLGGWLYVTVSLMKLIEIVKLLRSFIFSSGLLCVCIFKLSLYTGKIGKIFESKQSVDFYLSLPVMWLMNISAACVIGIIAYHIRTIRQPLLSRQRIIRILL